MATKTEQNIEILEKAGVALKGDENPLQISRMVRNLNKDTGAKPSTEGKFIVWLKIRTYVENDKRLECGVYMFDVVPSRLLKLSATEVEVFEDAVPSKKVAHIARWAGINPDGVEDEDIMGKVITEPKYL